MNTDGGIRPAVVHERQSVALQVAEERSDESTVRGQEQPVERIPLGSESHFFPTRKRVKSPRWG